MKHTGGIALYLLRLLQLFAGETVQYPNLYCISTWHGHARPAGGNENDGNSQNCCIVATCFAYICLQSCITHEEYI